MDIKNDAGQQVHLPSGDVTTDVHNEKTGVEFDVVGLDGKSTTITVDPGTANLLNKLHGQNNSTLRLAKTEDWGGKISDVVGQIPIVGGFAQWLEKTLNSVRQPPKAPVQE